MIGNKPEFKTADEVESVFYEAFRHCDYQVMTALWADGDVVCVHPGSGAIVGHEAVIRSWTHILANAQPPSLNYRTIDRQISDNLAVHLVAEEIRTGDNSQVLVLVTNVYRKFESGWLMVQHHGSVSKPETPKHTLQ